MIYKTKEWAQLPSDAHRAAYRDGILDYLVNVWSISEPRLGAMYQAYKAGRTFAEDNLCPVEISVEEIKAFSDIFESRPALEEHAKFIREGRDEAFEVLIYALAFVWILEDINAKDFMFEMVGRNSDDLFWISHIVEISKYLCYPSVLNSKLSSETMVYFCPHPYEILEEWAEERNVDIKTLPYVKEHTEITNELAAELGVATKILKHFWLNFYESYKENAWGLDNLEE